MEFDQDEDNLSELTEYESIEINSENEYDVKNDDLRLSDCYFI